VASLKDGSTVVLNTNSVVRVRLSGSGRTVDLERGEAFFEVAKDPRRPFAVRVAGDRVVAVGTKFSVFRRAADMRVVVTEGKVEVEEFEGDTPAGPVTQLPVGSIAQVGPAGVIVKNVSSTEAETYISWRAGYITLRDTDLGAVVEELNRYNKRQLVIADQSIASLRIGGNLRVANLDAFVRVLQDGFPVRAQFQNERIILTRAGDHR
jgi:transmembrane sensor